MKELIARLEGRNHLGLEITSVVFDGETHNSVFPAALTRGLRAVFADNISK